MKDNNGTDEAAIKDRAEFEAAKQRLAKNPPSIKEVRKFVHTDLARVIHFLSAIYQNEDSVNLLADILHGRFMNTLEKDRLQGDLFKDNA